MINKLQIENAEKRLAVAFKNAEAPAYSEKWTADVMGSVRRISAVAGTTAQPALQAFRMMWKLAMASVATAATCVMLYAFLADNSNTSAAGSYAANNFDSFASAVTAVDKL